jgi:phospholipid-binding lipoprotein MlaA
MKVSSPARLLVLTACLLLTGCATRDSSERPRNPDPLEPVNRVIFRVNDVGDRYLAEPLARAYEKASPLAFRRGAGNFFDNIRYPITVVNQFLQGKAGDGGRDLARFVINSTIGLLGVFDPATEIGLTAHDEDLGQTLAVWGVPEGPFLMVPVFGPYTLTHALGEVADSQVSPLVQYDDSSLTTKLGLWYLLHKRYRILGAEEEVRRAFDPYLFVRDAYFQNRRYLILDGNVPDEELFLDEEFDDFE